MEKNFAPIGGFVSILPRYLFEKKDVEKIKQREFQSSVVSISSILEKKQQSMPFINVSEFTDNGYLSQSSIDI
jgi:hypothetical protein